MSLNSNALLIARVTTLIAILTLLAYPAVVKIALPLACFFSLLSGEIQKQFKLWVTNRFVLCAMLLLTLFGIGVAYSEVSLNEALVGFFKYNKLVYILFLLPLFTDYRWRRIATNTLIVAVFIDIVVSLVSLHVVDLRHIYPGGYRTYAISVSVLLAFVAYVLGNRALDDQKYRWGHATLFLVAVYVLFFQYIERTGQVAFLALIALALWQRMAWKGVVAALVAVPLVAVGLFFTSSSFQQRVEVGYHELTQYVETGHSKDSSVGLRLAFAEYSWTVIKEHPLLGAGTGSFKTLYAKTGGPGVVPNEPLQDPHNEYVMMTFQIGFVGLALFLFVLLMQWRDTKHLPTEDKHSAQALIISLVTTGFFNAALFIALIGLFYVIFSGVYFSAAASPHMDNQ